MFYTSVNVTIVPMSFFVTIFYRLSLSLSCRPKTLSYQLLLRLNPILVYRNPIPR